MKIIINFTLLILISSSCASGPVQKKKSPLNYLNGEHYQNSDTPNVNTIPLNVTRKLKKTSISGKIMLDDPFLSTPTSVELQLLSKDKIIATTVANKFGDFKFEGFFDNESYAIKAFSPSLKGEGFIKIESYEVRDVIVTLYKTP